MQSFVDVQKVALLLFISQSAVRLDFAKLISMDAHQSSMDTV
jgi:hypothetical protein